MKKLYKSTMDKWVSGVLGGFGDYLDVDPVVLRLGFILVCVISAIIPLALAYLIMAFVMPSNPKDF